jgi:hypothetical protein
MPARSDVEAAAVAFQTYLRSLSRSTQAYLAVTWEALPGMTEAIAWDWAAQVAPVVERAQGLVAGATDSYVSIATGEPAAGLAAEDFSSEKLRGVPAAELWTRPPREVWWQLSKGAAFVAAMRMGLDRAKDLAATNLQLAHTHAFRLVVPTPTFRRKTRAGGCDLCVLAAGRPAKASELMAIHAHCHCVAVPVERGADPGPMTNPTNRATAAKAEAEGTEVAVHEHGEIGPVLGRAGNDFAGPHRVASAKRVDEQATAVESEIVG